MLPFSFYLLENHFSFRNHWFGGFLYDDVVPVGLSSATCHVLFLTLRQFLTHLTAKITLKMCGSNNSNLPWVYQEQTNHHTEHLGW